MIIISYRPKKYLHIHDWNYWWGVYHCDEGWDTPNSAEFSLTNDELGEDLFFHFDFYNLASLQQTIQDGEFIAPEQTDYPAFLEQAEQLINGKQDWFIGALYYPDFTPKLDFCNAPSQRQILLSELTSPPMPPHYGVIFLREERPLSSEILVSWAERLSCPLFGYPFSVKMARIPTCQETLQSYQKDSRWFDL